MPSAPGRWDGSPWRVGLRFAHARTSWPRPPGHAAGFCGHGPALGLGPKLPAAHRQEGKAPPRAPAGRSGLSWGWTDGWGLCWDGPPQGSRDVRAEAKVCYFRAIPPDLETQGQTSKGHEGVKGERRHGRGGWAAHVGWGVCLDLGMTDPRVMVYARGSGHFITIVHSGAECQPSRSIGTVFSGGQGKGGLWESLGCPLPMLWNQKERVFAELGSGQLPVLQGHQGPGPSAGHGMRCWKGRGPPGLLVNFGGWSGGERPGLFAEEGPRGTDSFMSWRKGVVAGVVGAEVLGSLGSDAPRVVVGGGFAPAVQPGRLSVCPAASGGQGRESRAWRRRSPLAVRPARAQREVHTPRTPCPWHRRSCCPPSSLMLMNWVLAGKPIF